MESDRARSIGEECGEKSEGSESSSSSTEEVEVESPRSVLMKSSKVECVHSQVLRIREEESHLGEDFLTNLERLSGKESKAVVVGGGGGAPTLLHRVNLVVLPRPILPCSPLSGKQNAVKALH